MASRTCLPVAILACAVAAWSGAAPAAPKAAPDISRLPLEVAEVIRQAYPLRIGECRRAEMTFEFQNGQKDRAAYRSCLTVNEEVKLSGRGFLYVLYAGKPAPDYSKSPGATCHGCGGHVGAFVFYRNAGSVTWRLVASAPSLRLGSYGEPPSDWKVVRVGPAKWAFVAEAGYTGMGETVSYSHVLYPSGGKVLVSTINTDYDTSGTGLPEEQSSDLRGTLRFEPSASGGRWHDAVVTLSGKSKGKPVPATPWRHVFREGKGWVAPEGYPLAW